MCGLRVRRPLSKSRPRRRIGVNTEITPVVPEITGVLAVITGVVSEITAVFPK